MTVLPPKVSVPQEVPTPHQLYTRGIAAAMASDADIGLNELRDLVQLILMECLVRKVTPQFFADMLDDTTDFLTHIARLEAAVHAKNALLLTDPTREPAVLEAAILKLMPEITELRRKMAEKTLRMAECREEGTTVS